MVKKEVKSSWKNFVSGKAGYLKKGTKIKNYNSSFFFYSDGQGKNKLILGDNASIFLH